MTVALVGAGPGDAELLTIRAARLLQEAEVVVHDALVGDDVLGLADPDAELVDVGKRRGRPVSQEMICALLVQLGSAGTRTVRLKGGDPYVFGRGGEEAIALQRAGVPYTVVPGIPSAVAAPSAAGVPLTHRGIAGAFTVVTGHRAADGQELDWDALARLGGTLVVLMGVARRGRIAGRLIASGMPGSTHVAAVTSATTAAEAVVRCRLDRLGSTPVGSPAVIVIGDVAALELASGSMAGLPVTAAVAPLAETS